MFTIDETNEMLNDIADEIPLDLYRELSGGIILLPQAKIHPQAINNDLYIMGEYCISSIGKCIKIYYGSFQRIYRHLNKENYYKQLKRVLVHEIRHHNETLAGCKDLILYDKQEINKYLNKHKKSEK